MGDQGGLSVPPRSLYPLYHAGLPTPLAGREETLLPANIYDTRTSGRAYARPEVLGHPDCRTLPVDGGYLAISNHKEKKSLKFAYSYYTNGSTSTYAPK